MPIRMEKDPALAALHVLAVDDNDYILRLVKMVVTDLGVAECLIARDAIEAMKILQANRGTINLMICDWNMPGITGLEFLRKLRADKLDMPFIMLTARADEGSVIVAKEVGVDAYLIKPFAPIQLEKKLKALVSGQAETEASIDAVYS